MNIKKLSALEVLDSRGNPTVEAYLELANGIHVDAQVPSGASTGTYEAHELRDGDMHRFSGLGTLKACNNISHIFDYIRDIDVEKQQEIDLAMITLDQTPDKSKLGANAMLAVSICCIKAAAALHHQEPFAYITDLFNTYFHTSIQPALPIPMFNILNGGKHADNSLDFQEFLIIPCPTHVLPELITQQGTHTQRDIAHLMQLGTEIFHTLGKILHQDHLSLGIGDEGGYAPQLPNAKHALDFICEATTASGYKLYDTVSVGMDCASNSFYDKTQEKYILHEGTNKHTYTSAQLADYYEFLLDNYPLVYLEDPFFEDAFDDFANLYMRMHEKHPIAYTGDDLTVTNTQRLTKALQKHAINSMIVKPNQIGTIYEVFQIVHMCLEHHILYVPSHRSGDTDDPFIADLAVGLGASFLKAGAPQRGERTAKYNRLLEIAANFHEYTAI